MGDPASARHNPEDGIMPLMPISA